MPDTQEFQAVFDRLRGILKKCEKHLVVQADAPGNYYLNTPIKRADGYVIFFGAVQIRKNYVSFHLIPVYASPELRDGMSPELKARMQGKSCFNFKKIEPKLFKELEAVTKKGFDFYKKGGLAPASGRAAAK